MKLSTGLSLWGTAGIAAVTLLDATPSKATLFINFIPLSNSAQTRIQVSGTINPFNLGTSSAENVNLFPTSGANSSRIVVSPNDQVRFNYAPSLIAEPGRRYAISGSTNPYTGSTGNTSAGWIGSTPKNKTPLVLRTSTAALDLWLPNTFTGGTTPTNAAKPIFAFFDVNLSLAQIGLASPQIVYTSGTEQIILREGPAPAPGPLPLLGAAAAFGYSRKLRNRIQKSTPSPSA
jgi:hypothetical protein